ncbi:MAG: hypothetical protein ABI321_20445 [Polyangia bacterium]
MGMLAELTGTATSTGGSAEADLLRDLVSAMVTADGSVDAAEHLTVEALYETLPQLRAAPAYERPPIASRKTLLARLADVENEAFRKQLFVVAVDLALSSEGANTREDAFVDQLRAALRIDDPFAHAVVVTIAHKYARAAK